MLAVPNVKMKVTVFLFSSVIFPFDLLIISLCSHRLRLSYRHRLIINCTHYQNCTYSVTKVYEAQTLHMGACTWLYLVSIIEIWLFSDSETSQINKTQSFLGDFSPNQLYNNIAIFWIRAHLFRPNYQDSHIQTIYVTQINYNKASETGTNYSNYQNGV